MKPPLVLYHKIYNGTEELNSKKHTITPDQVDSLVNMMNSNDVRDVEMAISFLKRSNCNQSYDDIIWKCMLNRNWISITSKDGVNKRIIRSI